jgi:hypothetical protein
MRRIDTYYDMMNNVNGGVDREHANQWSERSPGVAIRGGCSGRDEYGNAAGDIKRGVTPNTPIAHSVGVTPGPLTLREALIPIKRSRWMHGKSASPMALAVVPSMKPITSWVQVINNGLYGEIA